MKTAKQLSLESQLSGERSRHTTSLIGAAVLTVILILGLAYEATKYDHAMRQAEGGPPDHDGTCRDGEHLTLQEGRAWCYAPCAGAAK